MNLQLDAGDLQSARKPRLQDGKMRLGIFWPYSRVLMPSAVAAARNPDPIDLNSHLRLVASAEAVGMDFILIADGYAPGSEAATRVGFQDPRIHSLLWAVPLILATKHLGIVSTIHTTYYHPVHVARFAGHLDWLSGGRWGWNIVNGFREHEARLFGFDGLPDHDLSYDKADEFVSVIEELWSGIPIDHQGPHFRSAGRLAGPRPGGRPLLVSAASSVRGRVFAAAHCDYLFASPGFAALPALRQELAENSAQAGRAEPPGILVMANLLIRDEPGRARQEYAEITGTLDPEAQKAWSNSLAKVSRNDAPRELLGTADEVAEQILTLRESVGLNGVLFCLPLWDASEVDRLAPVLARLEAAGAWEPPERRQYSW